jgi:hypothetical protein
MSYPPDFIRLELLMDSAIAETDGGDRDAVIKLFIDLLTATNSDDDDELLEALGATDAERYEAACDLFQKRVQSGSRPKRGA